MNKMVFDGYLLKTMSGLPLAFISISILILIYIFFIKNKKRKIHNFIKSKKQINSIENKTNTSQFNFSPKNKIQPEPTDSPIKPKISIRKKTIPENLKGVSTEFFDQLIGSNVFLNFEMSELWQDSILSEIYMSDECCKRLDDYLKKENLEQTKFEANMIPEIGGILLGRFNEFNPGNFRITLEEFIAIESVNPNLYTLEFCTDSLVKELGDVVDTHPALSVVGWFHTHPGHGLFLSIPDLTIQMGFFKESYQIAMEIDPLSGQLDTGFFTQKNNGSMNNSLVNKPSWYSWRSIIGILES